MRPYDRKTIPTLRSTDHKTKDNTMGLFSDKCTAIVSLETGRHLTGDELAQAQEALRLIEEEKHNLSFYKSKRFQNIN